MPCRIREVRTKAIEERLSVHSMANRGRQERILKDGRTPNHRGELATVKKRFRNLFVTSKLWVSNFAMDQYCTHINFVMDYLELTIALSRQCSCIIEFVASTHELAIQRRSQAARGGDGKRLQGLDESGRFTVELGAHRAYPPEFYLVPAQCAVRKMSYV